MPMPMKPTPVQFCQHCLKQLERKRMPNGDLESLLHFTRRKYCGRGCMAQAFEARPKKIDPGWMTAHYHARKIAPQADCCVKCGRMGRTDVHHKDEDWQNNSPENLERLCRSCHIKEHRETIFCELCGKPQKAFGYCSKHYQRFVKWGDPRMVMLNGEICRSGD